MNPELEQSSEEKQAHKDLIVALFDGVEVGKHAALITDAIGALYVKDPRRAVTVAEVLYERLQRDYAISLVPEPLRKIFALLTESE